MNEDKLLENSKTLLKNSKLVVKYALKLLVTQCRIKFMVMYSNFYILSSVNLMHFTEIQRKIDIYV